MAAQLEQEVSVVVDCRRAGHGECTCLFGWMFFVFFCFYNTIRYKHKICYSGINPVESFGFFVFFCSPIH